MRRATENHTNTRKLAEYNKNTISKKSKVKDLGEQQCSLYFSSFHQETPMKPSQAPNWLSPPQSKKIFPHSGPELCCKERPGTQRHPTHSSGPVTSKGCFPSSPTASSVNRLHSKPKDRLSSSKHYKRPPGHTPSGPNHILNPSNIPYAMSRDRVEPEQTVPRVLPDSPRNGDSLSMPLPSLPHSPQFVRKSKNNLQSSHLRGDQFPESKDTLSNSGTKNESKQGQDIDKCQPLQCKTSSQKSTTVVKFDGSSNKNCMDSVTCHENDKRPHLQSPNSGEAQTTSKPTSVSSNGPTVEKSKGPRRPVVIPDDVDQLFAPDPLTYVVGISRKTPKDKIEDVPGKVPTPEKDGFSHAAPSSGTPATRSSCHKTQTPAPTAVSLHISPLCPASKQQKLDSISPSSTKPECNPVTHSSVELKKMTVRLEKAILPLSISACSHIMLDTTAPEQTPASCSQHPQLERQASDVSKVPASEEDPVAMDVDLDLSLALDFDVTESCHSSEDDHLISLKEIIERSTKPPDTPEKRAFSEPSTPRQHSSRKKNKLLLSNTKSGTYKNNLDDILKEINTNKRAKEMEMEHLTACKSALLRIAENEEAEENHPECISSEEQEFLQRYSLMSNPIKEVPPGEVVFDMEKVSRIFNQDTLQLRHCMVNPQGTEQKTLLWSSPAHLRLHVAVELFQTAYDSHSPCPPRVTQFLFKMMSIHDDRLVSGGMLKALFDIAYTAADERVNNGSHQFRVWVPSLADVTLILLNMGVAFVTLYPSENLQPLFTERDLLEGFYVERESCFNGEESGFAEHNYKNVFEYLSFSLGLCPRAYSDDELLLLLTVVSRISLDPHLILQSRLNLYAVHHRIVNNFMDWDMMLPKICAALTDLTADHHNMCHLVHLLPNSKRGRQLRQHLSLSMISKLIEGNCRYRPTQSNFQLSELRPYLVRMQPSSLMRNMQNSGAGQRDEEKKLDQQAYYLCYSLLTLVNEASNLQFVTTQQKEQLLCLSSELEMHVKCDIRESEKCLYRSKVKDLVARIYTKWQILLQRTRPLHNKLYDYWQPVDTLISPQEEQEDGDITVMEVDNPTLIEESAEEMEKETIEPEENMKAGEELVGIKENPTTKDTRKTEAATKSESDTFEQAAPHMENLTHSMLQPVELQQEADCLPEERLMNE